MLIGERKEGEGRKGGSLSVSVYIYTHLKINIFIMKEEAPLFIIRALINKVQYTLTNQYHPIIKNCVAWR